MSLGQNYSHFVCAEHTINVYRYVRFVVQLSLSIGNGDQTLVQITYMPPSDTHDMFLGFSYLKRKKWRFCLKGLGSLSWSMSLMTSWFSHQGESLTVNERHVLELKTFQGVSRPSGVDIKPPLSVVILHRYWTDCICGHLRGFLQLLNLLNVFPGNALPGFQSFAISLDGNRLKGRGVDWISYPFHLNGYF